MASNAAASQQQKIVEMHIQGDEVLAKYLTKLPLSAFTAAMRRGSSKAMRPVLRSAKANAQKSNEFGLLVKSLGMKQKTYRRTATVVTLVGPRKVFKKRVYTIPRKNKPPIAVYRNPVPYAHLVEGGTQMHSLTKGDSARERGKTKIKQTFNSTRVYIIKDKRWVTIRKHPGATAKPFLKPALEQHKANTSQIYHEEMRKELDKQVTKLDAKMRTNKRRVA